jgi:hypothetical protein
LRALPGHFMGVASGLVLEALESEVLFLGPLLKDLSCVPLLEIQSSLAELLRRRSSFPAVGRLSTDSSSSDPNAASHPGVPSLPDVRATDVSSSPPCRVIPAGG